MCTDNVYESVQPIRGKYYIKSLLMMSFPSLAKHFSVNLWRFVQNMSNLQSFYCGNIYQIVIMMISIWILIIVSTATTKILTGTVYFSVKNNLKVSASYFYESIQYVRLHTLWYFVSWSRININLSNKIVLVLFQDSDIIDSYWRYINSVNIDVYKNDLLLLLNVKHPWNYVYR